MSLSSDLRSALQGLREHANSELAQVISQVEQDIPAALAGDVNARARVAAALHDLMPGLAAKYQLAAAAVAADLYEEDRAAHGVAGSFTAEPVDLADGGHALAGWSLSTANTPTGLSGLLQGGLAKRIMQSGNQTIMRSSINDPGSDGWERQARGSGCFFCRMLASRGAVYSEETADFSAHDHCHCVAVAAWSGHGLPVKPYTPSARGSSKADRQRAVQWMKDHPDELANIPTLGTVDRNGQKALQHEIDTAERLASMGLDVRFLRRSHDQVSPDLEVESRVWEAKSPLGNSANTIANNVRAAARQSDRLILDLSRSARSAETALSEAEAAFGRYDRLVELLVIREVDGQIQQLARWRR